MRYDAKAIIRSSYECSEPTMSEERESFDLIDRGGLHESESGLAIDERDSATYDLSHIFSGTYLPNAHFSSLRYL